MGRAVTQGLVHVHLVNFRDYASSKHKVVDDRPFGGGPGMILKPEPIFNAIEEVLAKISAKTGEPAEKSTEMILLTPQGERYNQEAAIGLSKAEHLLMLCGRYEGFDERIRTGFSWREISIGDFVLSGGEIAAICLAESIVRLIPGALGSEESAWNDTFTDNLLEFPQYTRPRDFRGIKVPDILLSGDHGKIERWRRKMARLRTKVQRPDLDDKNNSAY